jgi:hypothetical protein
VCLIFDLNEPVSDLFPCRLKWFLRMHVGVRSLEIPENAERARSCSRGCSGLCLEGRACTTRAHNLEILGQRCGRNARQHWQRERKRTGCIAIRVEYTDGTVAEFIEFDTAARAESAAVLTKTRISEASPASKS